jgi:hypothetical protein
VNPRISAALIALTLFALATNVLMFHWQRERTAKESSSAQVSSRLLNSMASLLHENRALLAVLEAKPYGEEGNGILNSYLIKIRRDGVKSSAAMKEHLDALAENDAGLVALIDAYVTRAENPEFRRQSEEFRRYAIAWRDRWNSILELFMNGGSYPAAEISPPPDFLRAVQVELAATH